MCNPLRPYSSLGYRPPAPAAILPAEPVPMLAGLSQLVVQALASGQQIKPLYRRRRRCKRLDGSRFPLQ